MYFLYNTQDEKRVSGEHFFLLFVFICPLYTDIYWNYQNSSEVILLIHKKFLLKAESIVRYHKRHHNKV